MPRCHYCHFRGAHGRAKLVFMMVLMLFLGMLVAVSVAAVLDLTPDTHRQASQHGDLQF
ncbi:hypothetical protein [[Mycobacterium] burgundiense]|jgi:hypothetical protein|uniref:Uncharacterized protein n=1 Tax=[Mycobacterium] burgundiense TaxID=3064286 RepID=A0ABM9LP77_9MYCO|nr:hypothetical protein [Mycolicibacterium sp. MU0053]CAJ1502369.1 hypothetical protein MU0053_002164 [Mycolicibacterium sp. MU0053]